MPDAAAANRGLTTSCCAMIGGLESADGRRGCGVEWRFGLDVNEEKRVRTTCDAGELGVGVTVLAAELWSCSTNTEPRFPTLDPA